MLRTSLLQTFYQGTRGMLNAQAQTLKTQEQIASGKRVLTPADDPVAAARILKIGQDQSQIQQFLDNTTAVENRLSVEETQLASVTNLLQRMRELTIQAGTAGLSEADRQIIAEEVQSRLDELVNLANTRDTNGEYIFAGFQGDTKPFEFNADGTVSYMGDDGQRVVSVASSTTIPISDSGLAVFEAIPAGPTTLSTWSDVANNTGNGAIANAWIEDVDNYTPTATAMAALDGATIRFIDGAPADGVADAYELVDATGTPINDVSGSPLTGLPYTPGQPLQISLADFDANANGVISVEMSGTPAIGDDFAVTSPPKQSMMETLRKLADGLVNLTDSQDDKPKLEFLLQETLTNLTNAEENIGKINAKIGARLNSIENVRDIHEGVKLVNDQVLSDIRDLDYAEAVSRLTMESFALEAAQQSFSKISGLSLFNFLR